MIKHISHGVGSVRGRTAHQKFCKHSEEPVRPLSDITARSWVWCCSAEQCPGVYGAQMQLTPTRSSQNGVSTVILHLLYNWIKNNFCLSVIPG